MSYNPDIHHRHSIRLKDYDYSQAGAYFVTICAWQRECLFGEIVNGVMVLNDTGRIIESEWSGMPKHFTNINLDEYMIMPNHFHGILHINEFVGTVGAKQDSSALPVFDLRGNLGKADEALALPLQLQPLRGSASGSLCSIVQNFKSVSTRKINKFRNNPGCPVWQKNYYERVIRNEDELSRAREYIVSNPMKWELDKENPVNCRAEII
jgi:REP element-mobilizing transposase RayT